MCGELDLELCARCETADLPALSSDTEFWGRGVKSFPYEVFSPSPPLCELSSSTLRECDATSDE